METLEFSLLSPEKRLHSLHLLEKLVEWKLLGIWVEINLDWVA